MQDEAGQHCHPLPIMSKLTDCYLYGQLAMLTDGKVYRTDLNVLNEFILSQGGPFQVAFVNNLRTVVGHHDHMEIEIVLASARLRSEALLLTLKNFQK